MEQFNFTPSHSRHDKRWSIHKDNMVVCIGCIVEILEDNNTTLFKKKHALSEFLALCSSKPSDLYTVLSAEDPATIHFLSLLHGLIWYGERRLAALTVEAIVHMCIHLKSGDLLCSLLESIITKILQTKPCTAVIDELSLLSQLCQSSASLVQPLLLNQDDLLHYLVAGIQVDDVEMQTSIMYTLSCIYDGQHTPSDVFNSLPQSLLLLLDSAQSQQLIMNTLGFLKKLLCNQTFAEKFMNCSGTVSLPSVLKKILLQTSNTSIRITVVQSLCQLLMQSNNYAEVLLQADMAEFLYETLATMDHLLIGSVMCCLLLLSNCSDFYTKCHSMYGMEAIMRAIQHCVQTNHVKVAAKGFQMLTEIFTKQPEKIPVFSSVNILQQLFNLISTSVHQHHKSLVMSATSTLTSMLRVHHLGNTVDLGLIEKTMCSCLSEIKPHLNTSSNSATKQSLLGCLVQLMDQACSLAVKWQDNTSVKFTGDKSLQDFERMILQVCDSTCVPFILSNFDSVNCGDIFISLFSVLDSIHHLKIVGVVSASFLHITLDVKSTYQNVPRLESSVNGFLVSVCGRLLTSDDTTADLDNIVLNLQTTLPSLSGNTEDILKCLQEDNINGVTSKQTVYLTLLYLAFQHGDRLIEEPVLFNTLEVFIRNHADVSSLPNSIIKFSLLLYAICQQSVKSNYTTEGCALLIQGLNRLQNIDSIYTHHPAMLQWCFSTPISTQSVTRKLVELWLKSMKDRNDLDYSLLKEMLASNPTCLQVMLEILGSTSADIGEIITALLRDFLSVTTVTSELLSMMNERLSEIVQKVILYPKSDEDHIKLLLPLVCEINRKCTGPLTSNSINMKLLYHVCKLFKSDAQFGTEVQFHALNYLNLILVQAVGETDSPVLSMVLSNNYLFRVLEEWAKLICLPVYLSTALITISLLIQLFHQHKTQAEQRISLNINYLVNLVSGKNSSVVQASALYFWDVMLSTEFSCHLVSLHRGMHRSLLNVEDGNLAIPSRQLHQLYILVQNTIVIQDNEVLQHSAVTCLHHILVYSKKDKTLNNHLVHQPWNRKLLELTLDWCIHRNVLPLSVIYLLHTVQAFPEMTKTWKVGNKEKLLSLIEDVTMSETSVQTLYIDNVILPRHIIGGVKNCEDFNIFIKEIITFLKNEE